MKGPFEPKLSILLDRGSKIYTPGESLKGQIVAIFSPPVQISGLRLAINGEASVSFTAHIITPGSGGESEPTTVYSNENYVARRSKNLFLIKSGSPIEPSSILCSCRFRFPLPKNLPSSIEHKFGRIKYTLKAIFETSDEIEYEVETCFTIISTHDLNETPQASLPIKADKWKEFCYFCLCPWGRMHIVISVPSSGFVVGEVIPVTVYCKNESRTTVSKIKVQLWKRLIFTALKPERKIRADDTIEAKTKLENPFNIHPNGLVTLELNVPELIPSRLESCTIIKLDYMLKVEICFVGMHSSVVRVFPIFIGTVPLRKSLEMHNPSVSMSIQPSAPPLQELNNVPKSGRLPSFALTDLSTPDAPSLNGR